MRATLESLAYQTEEVLSAMQEDSGIRLSALNVDGGASANDFLMQFQADMIGVPVCRPACVETTAFGAACLAGLAVGFWESRTALRQARRMEHCFAPALPESERKARLAGWQRAVRSTMGWARE